MGRSTPASRCRQPTPGLCEHCVACYAGLSEHDSQGFQSSSLHLAHAFTGHAAFAAKLLQRALLLTVQAEARNDDRALSLRQAGHEFPQQRGQPPAIEALRCLLCSVWMANFPGGKVRLDIVVVP